MSNTPFVKNTREISKHLAGAPKVDELKKSVRLMKEVEFVIHRFGAQLVIENSSPPNPTRDTSSRDKRRYITTFSVLCESPGGMEFVIPLNTQNPYWKQDLLRSLDEIRHCSCG
jgi:hypothetical protein